MIQQSNNTVTLRHGPQSAFGTPATSTTIWRGVISDDLTVRNAFIESDEEDGTLAPPDQIQVGTETPGSVQVEVSYGAHDDWWKRAFNSAGWSSSVADAESTVVMTFSSTGGKNTITAASGDWQTHLPGVATGTLVHISGVSGAEHNGWFKVTNGGGALVTGTTLELAGLTTFTSASPQLDAFVMTIPAQITNGTTQELASIEHAYGDHTSGTEQYAQTQDLTTTGFEVAFRNKRTITGSVSVRGSTQVGNSTPLDASPTAAATADIYSMTDLDGFGETNSGNDTEIKILGFTYRFGKNDFEFDEGGAIAPVGWGKGRMSLSGTLQTWYQDDTQINKGIGTPAVPTSFFIVVSNSVGEYAFDVPRCHFTEVSRSKGPRDSGTIVSYSWIASYNQINQLFARIARRAA